MTLWDYCDKHPILSFISLCILACAMPTMNFSFKWHKKSGESESEVKK